MRYLYIIFGIVISSHTCHSQQNLFLNKQDTVIKIRLIDTICFYNVIDESFEYLKNEKGIPDTITIDAKFDLKKEKWYVEWIYKRFNDVIQKGTFNDLNQADGKFELFYGDSVSRCNFVNGYKEGIQSRWIFNNLHIKHYKKGKLDGIAYTIQDGKFLKRITEYKGGEKDGIDRGYWVTKDGLSIHYSDIFINGKHKNGKAYIYAPDGRIFIEETYRNGTKKKEKKGIKSKK